MREVVPLKKVVGTTVGELEGTGTWIFEHDNSITTVKYYWQVKTNSRWMNFLAPLLKPLFAWNHNAVMRWSGVPISELEKGILLCKSLTKVR